MKYRTDAYLCMRTETTIQRMTYFMAINHKERQATRHVTVSKQECSDWIKKKKTVNGTLVYNNARNEKGTSVLAEYLTLLLLENV